jgi:CubicO group peptidase (beta-lactamase class C family)
MAHRAGLVREPPLGSYFDATSPTLAATVASLNDTTLVHAPGTKMKYSNAGIAVVGRVVEVVTRQPFTQVVRERVLLPMGLTHSFFEATPEVRAHRVAAQMWTYWGAPFAAPTFELGIAPAGSLYAPIDDLATACSSSTPAARARRTSSRRRRSTKCGSRSSSRRVVGGYGPASGSNSSTGGAPSATTARSTASRPS